MPSGPDAAPRPSPRGESAGPDLLLVVLDRDGQLWTRRSTWWDRLRVRVRRHRLDVAIALGADVDHSPTMAVRAAQLVSVEERGHIARRTQRAAHRLTRRRFTRSGRLRRDALVRLGPMFEQVYVGLLATRPFPSQAVAAARVLLAPLGRPLRRTPPPAEVGALLDRVLSLLALPEGRPR